MKLRKYLDALKVRKIWMKMVKIAFIHCNPVNNNYQHDFKIMYKFVPNKSFGQ